MTQPTLPKAGDVCHGFRIASVTPLPALRGAAVLAVHERTGARAFHLAADDAENLFSISFPTPPPDDTGLPHIMEHSVLAGSERFPVREPFFEMLKMSMSTFLNAMTGPDCTYYPVASNVRRDLFNLADVYVDAVFHPLLTEMTFRREGHHLAPAKPEEPTGALTVSGIVFNEMKGAYSSPETRLYYTWLRALLPDTLYARNSAGEPAAIPDLTYDAFKAFFERYYHPSNALFFFYGDIPTADTLAFVDQRLAGYERGFTAPAIVPQSPWTRPRTCEAVYPVGADEAPAGKTFLTLHWLLGSALDPEATILNYVLSLILIGNEAAPLKKALIESKLGQDLVHSGSSEVGAQAVFSVGLKGSEAARGAAFEALVLDTLRAIAAGGIAPARVEAAFQQAAYHYLEIMPQFPLHMLDRVLSVWPYGGDPVTFLDMGRHLAAARQRWTGEPGLFERLIRTGLIENPHRLLTTLSPDAGLAERTEAALAERMRSVRARLSDEEACRLASEAAELERLAGTPNPPEAIARLPQLHPRDLPARPRRIPTSVASVEGITVLRNDVFSNGVNYVQAHFDLRGLPADLWPWLERYRDAFSKLGAAGLTYEQMAERQAASTGGLACWTAFQRHATEPAQPVWGLRVACNALDDQVERALEVLHDVVFRVEPRETTRLSNVLGQSRAAWRTSLLNNGQPYAQMHAARGLSREAWLDHVCHSLPQVDLLRRLTDRYDAEAEALMARLEQVRDVLRDRGRLTLSFTGSDRGWEALTAALRTWPSRAVGAGADPATGFVPDTTVRREGLALAVQVAHCAQVLTAPRYGDVTAAALAVGSHILRFDYLLSEIRLKGNAYGAGSAYSPLAGLLHLTSFRDPHIARTLGVFARAPDFVHEAAWRQPDIDRAIIGVAKNEERPIRPADATGDALTRHVTGITDDRRDAFYADLLAVTPVAVRHALTNVLDEGLPRAPVCVVSSREKLEAANRELGDKALAITEIAV
jgi:Zn-dependent M16 (insulinase) family peptidase